MNSENSRSRDLVDFSSYTKERIRTDLQSAMRTGSSLTVKTLRALLTAIDNAQVVPVGDAHIRYTVRPFGDGSAEAPRRPLTQRDVLAVIENEVSLRLTAASELDRCAKAELAAEARQEAAIIARYSGKT